MCYNRAAILLLLVASLSHAQDSVPSEREVIQQLVLQVTALRERVAVLESLQRANAPPAADATSPSVSTPVPQAADNNSQSSSLLYELMISAAFSGRGSEKSTTRC